MTSVFTREPTRIGSLLLIGTIDAHGLALRGLFFAEEKHAAYGIPAGAKEDASPFANIVNQLDEYARGVRTSFDVRLAPIGTEFQTRVWSALAKIPYGATTTYGAIARAIGSPNASRAVGAANGKNPISIIVPCHRVVGENGTLTGYAGGLSNKRALLELEARSARRHSPAPLTRTEFGSE